MYCERTNKRVLFEGINIRKMNLDSAGTRTVTVIKIKE